MRGAQGPDQAQEHGAILVRDPAAPDATTRGNAASAWWLWLLFALLAAALPILVVRYPPVLDLPQLLAQVRLFGETVTSSASEYRIHWWAPNKIGYPFLALALAGPAAWVARIALLLVAGVWIAGVFLLARLRGGVPAQAGLATLALWNGSFLGGFVHFVLGMVGITVWIVELDRETGEASGLRVAMRTCAAALLLYLCHVLWLIAGVGVAVVALGLRRARRGEWLARCVGVAPVLVLTAFWFRSFAASEWGWTAFYGAPWWRRLISLEYLASVLFGALRGPVEVWLTLALAGWLAAGALAARRRPGSIDRLLLVVGLVTLAGSLLLPEVVGDTTMFGRRWGWVAVVFLLLAVPPPLRPGATRNLVVATLVLLAAGAHLGAWRAFGRDWTEGFERLVARIEPGDRLLELDYVRRTPPFWVHPLFQMAAWAQVERGASVGYSFAETDSSLVVFDRRRARRDWTPNLHKRPDLVTSADLGHFDWVLVVAADDVQSALVRRFPRLARTERSGPWILYSVRRDATAEAGS